MSHIFRSTVSVGIDFEAEFGCKVYHDKNGVVKVEPDSVASVRLLEDNIIEKIKEDVKRQLEEEYFKKV